MIKSEIVKIKLTRRNIGYYSLYPQVLIPMILNTKGMQIPNYGEEIIITTDLLKNGVEQKINIICDKCGIIYIKKFNNICRDRKNNNGCDICNSCAHKKSGITQRLNIKDVYNLFMEKNIIPLFEDKDYLSVGTKLNFKCKIHEDILQSISYNGLKKSNHPCKKCRTKVIADKQKMKIGSIYNLFQKRNLIPLFEKTEEDRYKKLQYSCEIHQDIQFISYNQLRQTKYGCKSCLNRKGENNINWKGGITPLIKYMRNKLNDWKKIKLKNNNYTCEITNIVGNKLVVHHITNFSFILGETLNNLNLKIKPIISDYSSGELKLIEEKLIDLHSKYKSVVISKDLHELFHKKYGIKNNNEEQYVEFIERYMNGEFDRNLPSKYRVVNNPCVINR